MSSHILTHSDLCKLYAKENGISYIDAVLLFQRREPQIIDWFEKMRAQNRRILSSIDRPLSRHFNFTHQLIEQMKAGKVIDVGSTRRLFRENYEEVDRILQAHEPSNTLQDANLV